MGEFSSIMTSVPIPEPQPLFENYMLSDVCAGYNNTNTNIIDLYYEITQNLNIPAQPQNFSSFSIHKKQSGMKEIINDKIANTTKNFCKKEYYEESKENEKKNEKEEKNPFSCLEFFESAKRTASNNSNGQAQNDDKNNTNFSFNTKGDPIKVNSNNNSYNENNIIAPGNNNVIKNESISRYFGKGEAQVNALYNEINKTIPDHSKFFSHFPRINSLDGSTNSIPTKKIEIKKKKIEPL